MISSNAQPILSLMLLLAVWSCKTSRPEPEPSVYGTGSEPGSMGFGSADTCIDESSRVFSIVQPYLKKLLKFLGESSGEPLETYPICIVKTRQDLATKPGKKQIVVELDRLYRARNDAEVAVMLAQEVGRFMTADYKSRRAVAASENRVRMAMMAQLIRTQSSVSQATRTLNQEYGKLSAQVNELLQKLGHRLPEDLRLERAHLEDKRRSLVESLSAYGDQAGDLLVELSGILLNYAQSLGARSVKPARYLQPVTAALGEELRRRMWQEIGRLREDVKLHHEKVMRFAPKLWKELADTDKKLEKNRERYLDLVVREERLLGEVQLLERRSKVDREKSEPFDAEQVGFQVYTRARFHPVFYIWSHQDRLDSDELAICRALLARKGTLAVRPPSRNWSRHPLPCFRIYQIETLPDVADDFEMTHDLARARLVNIYPGDLEMIRKEFTLDVNGRMSSR